MKRSWRWYLAWGTILASLFVLLFIVTLGPAQAWTQTYNTFKYDPTVGKYVGDPNCGTQSEPCMYWQEPVKTSIGTWYYMDPSLLTAYATGGGSYDFLLAAENAMAVWDNAPAWNPYMYPWASGDPTFGGSVGMADPTALPCETLGQTLYDQISPVYGPTINAYWGDTEYYAFIEDTQTVFNSLILWNSDGDYSGGCFSQNADGEAVALHEFGHVMGLGHTANPAVMYEGPILGYHGYHSLQNDDKSGIWGIYPGIQPDTPGCCPP